MDLVTKIRAALIEARDPENAVAMGRYMRDRFIFLGLNRPQYRAIVRSLFASRRQSLQPAEIKAAVKDLWAQPEREFQYVAVDLLAQTARRLPASAFRLIDQLLRRKAWWDTVDPLSAPVTARLLRQHPGLWAQVDEWSLDKEFWVRRAAILVQRVSREKTDPNRLFAYVKANASDPEFFIQKAIGWALRSYAKTDEQKVLGLLTEIKLSPLAIREAMRNSGKTTDR